MATKKKAKKSKAAGKTNPALSRLQGSMQRLQKDAETLLRRTQKQASSLISKDQRRAVDRLLTQATRLRDDLERRAERATKDLESRTERFLSTIEKEAGKRLGPLLRRLDLPSRQELQTLGRRVTQLERRLSEKKSTAAHPAPSAPSSPVDEPQETSSIPTDDEPVG